MIKKQTIEFVLTTVIIILLLYFVGTKTSLHHENDIDKSSQRSSGEVLENQRDSMASFSSFRNQVRITELG